MPLNITIIRKNGRKFIAYFADKSNYPREGETREQAVGKLILEQGKFNGIQVKTENSFNKEP